MSDLFARRSHTRTFSCAGERPDSGRLRERVLAWDFEVERAHQKLELEMRRSTGDFGDARPWWRRISEDQNHLEPLATPREVAREGLPNRERFRLEAEEFDAMRLACELKSLSERDREQRFSRESCPL